MKRTEQIEESKNLIADAFLELLKDKPFEVIRLNEIADNAGVSRMTLHRHFKSKENIILFRLENTIKKMGAYAAQKKEISFESDVLYRLEMLKSLPNVKLLCHCDEIGYLITKIEKGENGMAELYLENEVDKYTKQFIIGGFNRVIKEWIRSDFDLSPEDMKDNVMKLLTLYPKS